MRRIAPTLCGSVIWSSTSTMPSWRELVDRRARAGDRLRPAGPDARRRGRAARRSRRAARFPASTAARRRPRPGGARRSRSRAACGCGAPGFPAPPSPCASRRGSPRRRRRRATAPRRARRALARPARLARRWVSGMRGPRCRGLSAPPHSPVPVARDQGVGAHLGRSIGRRPAKTARRGRSLPPASGDWRRFGAVDTTQRAPHKPGLLTGTCVSARVRRSTAGECPERQRGRTVNPLAYAFVGSSPTSPTSSKPQ